MDTTTQYKLNKYSKKINDAYQKNNITKVNEYMHHQFSYMNKYVQQLQGGGLEEIQSAITDITTNVTIIMERIAKHRVMINTLNEVMGALSSIAEAGAGVAGEAVAREAGAGVASEAVVAGQ